MEGRSVFVEEKWVGKSTIISLGICIYCQHQLPSHSMQHTLLKGVGLPMLLIQDWSV
jgi:hypothetical protein